MDLEDVLAQLKRERDNLEAAIVSLERLDRSGNRGPGRLPDLATRNPTNGFNGDHRAPHLAHGQN